MATTPGNLREEFLQAVTGDKRYYERNAFIAECQQGSLQDFCARFDKIAETLVDDLKALQKEIESGRSIIERENDSYKLSQPPLEHKIYFPATVSADDIHADWKKLMAISGLQRIRAICADPAVDMRLSIGRESGSFMNEKGQLSDYEAITVRINPFWPFAAEVKKQAAPKA